MKKSNEMKNNPYIMFIIVMIVSVFSLSLLFSAKTLAKYIDSFDKDKEVVIAKWDVSIDTDANKNVNIISANTTQTYKVRVKSVSEVAAHYSIKLTNVPDGVSVYLDDETTPLPALNNEIIFDNVGTLNVGDTAYHEHRLTFEADLTTEAATNEVNIEVLFEQVEL